MDYIYKCLGISYLTKGPRVIVLLAKSGLSIVTTIFS